MLARSYILVAFALGVLGCSEGTKPEPLVRHGAPPREKALPAPTPTIDADGKTLYERLGREDGVIRIVDQFDLDLAASPKKLSKGFRKNPFVDFLITASSHPRPNLAADLGYSAADWAVVIPVLRSTLTGLDVAEADRNELIANIEKSR